MGYLLIGRFIGWLVNVVTFPGVIVHEVAHVIFCRVVGVTVHEVVYFRPFGNPSGYVLHDIPANLGQQFWITVGPFIINSTLCFIGGAAALFWSIALPGEGFFNDALMWISVSIGMHAIPSLGDANSLWKYATGRSTGSTLSQVLAFPVVAILALGSLLRFFWADLFYALAIFYSSNLATAVILTALLSPQNYQVATPRPTAVQPLMPTSASTSMPVAIQWPSATPVPPERPTQDTQLWVCGELAYGYSGPGFAYPVVWQMSQKDGWTVRASDKVGSWWTIRTENGNVFMHETTLCPYPPARAQPRAPTSSPSPTPIQVFGNVAVVQTAELTGGILAPTIAVLDKGVAINAARIGHSDYSRQTQFRIRFRVSMLDLAGNYVRAQTKLGALDLEDDRGHPKTIGSMKKDWPILEIQTNGDIATVTIEGWINDSALP